MGLFELINPHSGALQLAAKKIIVAGAIADPIDGGLIIFEGVSKEEVHCRK